MVHDSLLSSSVGHLPAAKADDADSRPFHADIEQGLRHRLGPAASISALADGSRALDPSIAGAAVVHYDGLAPICGENDRGVLHQRQIAAVRADAANLL